MKIKIKLKGNSDAQIVKQLAYWAEKLQDNGWTISIKLSKLQIKGVR